MNLSYQRFSLHLKFQVIFLILLDKSLEELKTVKTKEGFIIFHVGSIFQLNDEIKHELDETGIMWPTIQIIFENQLIIGDTTDLLVYSSNSANQLTVSLGNFGGFLANGTRIFKLNPYGVTSLRLMSGSFEFYDTRAKRLDGSCRSLLKMFHGIDDDQFDKANKTHLVEEYVGPFSMALDTLYIFGNVAFNNKICPLVFRPALFKNVIITKIDHIGLSTNQLEFEDFSKTVNEEYDMGFDVTAFTAVHVYNIALDKRLLNRDIFKHLYQMSLTGVVESISEDAFTGFHQLQLSLCLERWHPPLFEFLNWPDALL